MNKNLYTIPCAALSIVAGAQCTSMPKQAELSNTKPNIIFIYADDWGWGDLSAHGHTGLRTPNLDKMIAEGTDYHQFNVCSPVSSSSRAAIMTGNFPSRHGLHGHISGPEQNAWRGIVDFLDPNVYLLTRFMQEAGYKTGHFGKWHLGSARNEGVPAPTEYGIDESLVHMGWGNMNEQGPKGYETTRYTRDNVNATINFIEKHKDTAPFYVNLWIHESHRPNQPALEELYEYATVPEPFRTYYATVTAADKHIGRLMDYLKESGLDENTLVIFSSDNGPETPMINRPEAVGNTGGQRGQKRSILEGGIRVPFIVRYPGKVAAGKVDKTTLISAVDILPTFCNLAGLELPKDYMCDGEDFTALLEGREFAKKKPVLQFWQGGTPTQMDMWPHLTAKDTKWKLVMNMNQSRVELYDYLNDWSESRDLASQHPDVVERLKKVALEYYESLNIPADRKFRN